MTEPLRVHVPAKVFSPAMSQGYRSDIVIANGPYRTMAPISIGARLTDILLHGARAISGAGDFVMWDAPYGIMKVYLSWPGYGNAEELISYDTYCNKERPTRASVVCAIARMFTRFMENCKTHRIHPTAARWRIGEGALTGQNVIFNQLVNTYENVWQVDCDFVV